MASAVSRIHGQKERLVLDLAQHAHRLIGHAPVEVRLVGHVALLALGRVGEIRRRRARDLRLVVVVVLVIEKLRRAPRPPVTLLGRVPVVKDLADVPRHVAMLLKVLRQRHHVGL